MFCKSGILIFIFAENNYSIYAHTMLIKTPLLHQSFGPRVLLSLSHSLSLSLSPPPRLFQADPLEHRGSLSSLFCPHILRLYPIETAPEASMNRASPMSGTLLAFCVNQGISASFSLLYFLIGPLQTTRFWSIKGPQQVAPRTGTWYT